MRLVSGPGATSMYGNFEELGPFSLAADGSTLVPRNFTWNLHYHLLFVDNPVGTGFSYTEDERGYVRNMADVANDLYAFLELWFAIYVDYQKVDFYITGESYAGKCQSSYPAIGDGSSKVITIMSCSSA